MTKSPDSFVVAVFTSWRSVCVSVTFAPVITAPPESFTVPTTSDVETCASRCFTLIKTNKHAVREMKNRLTLRGRGVYITFSFGRGDLSVQANRSHSRNVNKPEHSYNLPPR